MLWKQDLVHRYSKNKIGDKKICCHGIAVTMVTNAYFGPAKYHIFLHDCHTFAKKNMLLHSERKMWCNLKVIDNR